MSIFERLTGFFAEEPEAFEFAAAFSRTEFALKSSSFLRAGRNGIAEPDWDAFANAVATAFEHSVEEHSKGVLVNALLAEPPRVQKYSSEAGLQWEPKSLGSGSKALRACVAVRRIRNNFFHGGKDIVYGDQARNREFLQRGLVVLELLLPLDERVSSAFERGLGMRSPFERPRRADADEA